MTVAHHTTLEQDASAPERSRRHVGRARRFAGEVARELRAVTWPTLSQVRTYTLVVLGFLVTMVALTGAADAVIGSAVRHIFG